MNIMPKKFRSVRVKNGSHRRNKSSEPGQKSRTMTAETFFSMFKPDSARQAQKEKEEEGRETAKIKEVSQLLKEQDLDDISREHIRCALSSRFAAWDPDKAIELLRLQQEASAGIVRPFNPHVRMLGAENRENVTCYLDSLLFAMFSRLDAFECMLKNDAGDENQRKLATLIRLWVNLLRTGNLIDTDMTQNIQEALASCGWKDAQYLEQQDTSEAFAFITETLQLPLLTLQVDLFHQGKGDKDDHKVVYERLLNLAVPPDPDGKGIKLEDCLEEYFNNQVDVLRDSLEEKHGADAPSLLKHRSTIRIVAVEDDPEVPDGAATPPSQLEDPTLLRRWTVQTSESLASGSSLPPPALRHRSTSVIRRIVVDEEGRAEEADSTSLLQKAKQTGSTVVKAVTIPAWQFFRLIPWHATSNSEPLSDVEVASQFNKRPVVGICLKRYTMTDQGIPIRQNTFIDIPESMRLPYFMKVDDLKLGQEAYGLSAEYKLVLQSVVCHRGDSLHSGHYVAFARAAPKLLTDNRRHDRDPPPDYEEEQWVQFDDLHEDNRVSYVDDLKQSLREEMPYLLFYQIVPMVEMATSSAEGSVIEPPSYNESAVNPQTPVPEADRPGSMSRSTSGYFSSSTTLGRGHGPGIRFSSELERPSRLSLDGGPYLTVNGSRRGSVAVSEPTLATTPGAVTPEGPGTPGEESTATRLSRAAARFAKSGSSKSRPGSQAGEGRISITMSRLGGLMRASREPLVDGVEAAAAPPEQPESEGGRAQADGTTHSREGGRHFHVHPHPHPHPRKDRGKSRSGDEKDRERSGARGREKESDKESKTGVPERECLVM